MAIKRKTLPNEIESLIQSCNFEKFKTTMLHCIPNATQRNVYKCNALCFSDIPEEFVHWLIDYGTDINHSDYFGYTPLHHQAGYHNNSKLVELYLNIGADVNAQSHLKTTPLHHSADHGCTENVEILLSHGADIYAEEQFGKTPLEYLLSRCRGIDITYKISTIELLLNQCMPVTEIMRESVENIGKEIEFYRANYPKHLISDIDKALDHLYSLFDVSPVPKRRFHDGKSPITVSSKTWQKQYQELWDYLVPASGPCNTVQGEVIRINGRISHEILDNGSINWDKDFKIMLNSLKKYFKSAAVFGKKDSDEAEQLITALSDGDYLETEINRLCELSVKWVINNPEPVLLKNVEYKR